MASTPLVILSGTNRPGSNTRKVAAIVEEKLKTMAGASTPVEMIDIATFSSDIFSPSCYAEKPKWFSEKVQPLILQAQGLVVVTPEYNGSFPGVLKYFIDMLKFPESLVGLPVAFIGIAAGQFGALRSVEQLTAIFHYRNAHIFGDRLFVPNINEHLKDGKLAKTYSDRLDKLLQGFAAFAGTVKAA